MQCFNVPYPAESWHARETGRVVVTIHISETGQVHDTEVKESSGYPRLDMAVVNRFNTCKFKPATENGVPTPYTNVLAYVFKIAAP